MPMGRSIISLRNAFFANFDPLPVTKSQLKCHTGPKSTPLPAPVINVTPVCRSGRKSVSSLVFMFKSVYYYQCLTY